MSDLEFLADQLKTARNTVQSTFRSDYPEKILPFSDSIHRRMLATGEGELQATLECAKKANDPMSQLLYLSAGLEMVAPSRVV